MVENPPSAAGRDDGSGTTNAPAARWWNGRMGLGLWWASIFLLTHLPIPSTPGESPVPDKLIHFLMYLGLGWFLPGWRGAEHRATWREAFGLFVVLALYAVADELLQIPVGRTAEWLDGAADLAGGACGLALAFTLRRTNAAATNTDLA